MRSEANSPTEQTLRLSDISDSPYQPRKRRIFKTDVAELISSLRAVGQLQPIIASPANEPGKYHVHAGHRRCAALRFMGCETVRAFVRELDAREARKLALSENLGREDLSAVEQADALAAYAQDYSLTLPMAATELGIAESTRKRLACIITTNSELRDVLFEHAISARASAVLVKLEKERNGVGIRRAKAFADGRLSVAKLEAELAAIKGEKLPRKACKNKVSSEIFRTKIDLRVQLNIATADAHEIDEAIVAMNAALLALGVEKPPSAGDGGSSGTPQKIDFGSRNIK